MIIYLDNLNDRSLSKDVKASSDILSTVTTSNIRFDQQTKDSLWINDKRYVIQDKQLAQALLKLNLSQLSFLLSAPQSLEHQQNKSVPVSADLSIFGKTATTDLPQVLKQLIVSKHLPLDRLLSLAAQPKGYYLADATVANGKLIINSDVSLPLPKQMVRDGEYRVSIIAQNNKLQLALSPILFNRPIQLTAYTQPTEKLASDNTSSTQVIAKPNSAVLFTQLLKIFSQPLSSLQPGAVNPLPKTLPKGDGIMLSGKADGQNQTQLVTSTSKVAMPPLKFTAESLLNKPAVLLNKNITLPTSDKLVEVRIDKSPVSAPKATIAPEIASSIQNKSEPVLTPQHRGLKHSLETVALNKPPEQPALTKMTQPSLLKFLPMLSPRALSMLALPNTLKTELLDGVKAFSPNLPTSEPVNSQNSSLSILFKLLLGQKALSTSTQPSTKLALQVELLGAKLQLSNSLLSILERSQSSELVTRLLSNISLFQQASSDSSQTTSWLFSLPYKIDDRFEELEGQFEQEKNEDGSLAAAWRLQLKFSLTNGGMLIKAQVEANKLTLTINSDTQSLLSKIEKHLQALEEKLTQVGFTETNITAKQAEIPVTLLPGDHYLVKIKA
ncbi:flagellar hook-length control protein FliK [Shewanella sp. Scap07]|uniref:flagellar hook-length control protein FliK n=1 Tax=Shewanella sp. Scap07 TaxID=2589987 RepID=UPI0015B89FDD|nr:flagellar hook-length control protein FliK [Shewanella sp. Scap07]QLE86127.1 flagellar hook-length control protein FliK [Shewanella sp. Scap07]